MELTWSELVNFVGRGYYTVNCQKVVKKTIYVKLPFQTERDFDGNFPQYLKGYEICYHGIHGGDFNANCIWTLTDEARKFRNLIRVPFEVECHVYDVTFNEKGKAEIRRRYESHKRTAEKYARLLEKIG